MNDTVTIDKGDFAALLGFARNMRSAFLMCAPRFASGSTGEQLVGVAKNFGAELDRLDAKLKGTGGTRKEEEVQ